MKDTQKIWDLIYTAQEVNINLAFTLAEAKGIALDLSAYHEIFGWLQTHETETTEHKSDLEILIYVLTLETVTVPCKGLTEIPKSIGKLRSLKCLILGWNKLTYLPDSIGELSNLGMLHVLGNKLTNLPDTIGNLTLLEYLYVGGNQLTELPETIGGLKNLTELCVNNNRLETIPKTILNLKYLEKIDIKMNNIKDIPDRLGYLPNLRWLHLGKKVSEKVKNNLTSNKNTNWYD